MSAESIEQVKDNNFEAYQGLGGIALQRFSGENADQDNGNLWLRPAVPPTNETSYERTYNVAATLVRGKFKEIKPNLKADERDVQRDKAREDSVRMLFKTYGMLPKDSSVDEPFSRLYREVESTIPDRDKSYIGDLAEKYADNPAITVLYRLNGMNEIPKDDIVFMRRVMLVLVDEHSLSQRKR